MSKKSLKKRRTCGFFILSVETMYMWRRCAHRLHKNVNTCYSFTIRVMATPSEKMTFTP